MTKIAIDVVILPSDDMMDKTIAINKELLKTFDKKIILDKENCLPHISLAMGCIEEDKIHEIRQILEDVAKDFSPMELVAEKLKPVTAPTGKKISGLDIKNTDNLQSLHETVMKKLRPYLSYDVEINMLSNPEEAEEVTLYWIKRYAKKHDDPSLFHPHITVGHGEIENPEIPIKFSADRIALCHLGNYCTCRRVLISIDLK